MDKNRHEDEYGHAHSRLSVLIMIASFFLIIYLMNMLIRFYENSGSRTVASADTRVCESNKPGTNLPPPPIPVFAWNHTGLISLWFDDAWLSEYTNAYPILQKEKLIAAVSIATRFICKPQFMTWVQLRTLQSSGWETIAHSISHQCDLTYYNVDTSKYELGGSKQIIESHGLRADQFAMPCGFSEVEMATIFGSNVPPIVTTAKQFFASYRTTKSTRLNTLPIVDPYNLKALQVRNTTSIQEVKNALDEAKAQQAWLILVFHQIDNSGQPFSIPVDKFSEIIHLVKASGLPVVLPSQALALKPNHIPAS